MPPRDASVHLTAANAQWGRLGITAAKSRNLRKEWPQKTFTNKTPKAPVGRPENFRPQTKPLCAFSWLTPPMIGGSKLIARHSPLLWRSLFVVRPSDS